MRKEPREKRLKRKRPVISQSYGIVKKFIISLEAEKPAEEKRDEPEAQRQAELKNKFEKLKQERIQRYQGVNLYVKNLDDSITDDILREHFSQFGTITSAKV